MSKIGKKPITIPAKTTVKLDDDVLSVTGPKGTLTRTIRPEVKVEVGEKEVTVTPTRETKFSRALWGTTAAHIRNMIAGVHTPYVKKLILEGIGYRAEVQGKNLNLALGLSHPVKVAIPEGVTVVTEKNLMTITGIDIEAVGQFAASIRALKKPEPYKGKGFRYEGEVILRKQGKKATA